MTSFRFLDAPELRNVEWTVYQIEGREAVSDLFHFSVFVGADLAAVEAATRAETAVMPEARATDQSADQTPIGAATIQQPVALRFTRDDATERFGIVAAATVLGVVSSRTTNVDMVVVRFDVVPRAWVTVHRRRSRVFQNLRMHQIVSRVLTEMGVSHRWALSNSYPKRVCAVQYDETDWEFVTRLLAEEGVFFFFEHGPFAGGTRSGGGTDLLELARRNAAPALNALGEAFPAAAPHFHGAGAAASLLTDDGDNGDEDPAQETPGNGKGGPPGVGGDVLVFVDRPGQYLGTLARTEPDATPPAEPDLHLVLRSADGMVTDASALRMFTPRRTVRPLRTHLRDYEFKNPLLELSARSSTFPTSAGTPSPDLEVYHHHGEYERPDIDNENARLHLEQHRADVAVSLGEGRNPDLGAGVRFRFENQSRPRTPVMDGNFAAVRVWHRFKQPDIDTAIGEVLRFIAAFEDIEGLFPRGADDGLREPMAPTEAWTYANRFECVRDMTAFRPPRPRRAPRTSIELATVVGPVGEEVYTDKHGRIRVQFHWDREGKWLPRSSCWVRVAQTWSGAGFGAMFIPRVGMEVVVAFVGGDPDRPVVVGTLYNGTHPTPEALPENKTRSGFRTQLSPDGGGGNELSFEDARDHAEVRLIAQKDLNIQVGDTCTTTVTGDAVTLVASHQYVGVQGDGVVGVGGARAALVSETDSLVVGGDRSTRVAGNALASVGGDTVTSVTGNAVQTASRDALHHVAGDQTVRVDGNAVTHVGGRERDGKGHCVTFVEGSWQLHATRDVTVQANTGGHDEATNIVLRCGASTITLTPHTIELHSGTIMVHGTKMLELRGGTSVIQLDSKGIRGQGEMIDLRRPENDAVLRLSSTEATVRHTNCTRLQGRDIHLVTPTMDIVNVGMDAKPLPPPEPNVALQLTDEPLSRQGIALPAGSKWRAVSGGLEAFRAEGELEEQGILRAYVPKTVDSLDVFVWPAGLEHAYPPDAGPLHWKVHLRDDLGDLGAPDASETLRGVRVRLRNLGYLPAADVDREGLDALTEAAVRRFRRDHRLAAVEVGPVLDAAMIEKLREVYGA